MAPPWSPASTLSFQQSIQDMAARGSLLKCRLHQSLLSRPFNCFLLHAEEKFYTGLNSLLEVLWTHLTLPAPSLSLPRCTGLLAVPATCRQYSCLSAFAPALLAAWNTFPIDFLRVYCLTYFETFIKCHLFNEVFLDHSKLQFQPHA